MLIFTLVFYAHFSYADQITVWAKDPMSARTAFAGQNVKWDDADAAAKENADDGYLPPRERDVMFNRIGFNSIVAKMDNVDKDLLVMSAHASPVADLKKFYPRIKPEDLTRLKVAVDAAVAK